MDQAPVPLLASIEEIDGCWMRAVLEGAGINAVPTIIGIEPAPIGAGNASDTRRLQLRYTAESSTAPRSVICKFHSQSPVAHAGAIAMGAYVREARSLQLIAAHNACAIPRPYLAAARPDGINLVMEDLSQSSTAGDQIRGCTLAEAQAVVDALARLHGALPADRLSETDWLMKMPPMAAAMGERIRRGAARASGRLGHCLSTRHLDAIAQCAELAEGWHLRPAAALAFTHGDPRVDNILFRAQDGRTDAVLIDWQMAGLRDPFYDLAYFIASSVPTALRRRHESALIERYLGHSNNPGMRRGEAVSRYRQALLASFTLVVLSIDALEQTPAVDRLLTILIDRNTAALEDWHSFAAIRAAIGKAPA